jgi:hypothetical protein
MGSMKGGAESWAVRMPRGRGVHHMPARRRLDKDPVALPPAVAWALQRVRGRRRIRASHRSAARPPVKVELPETLKADLPSTFWGKILSATPVALAVVATLLAGLASSEMTRAQYDRSLAAQLQSKAGDQWNFFQGKKLRGALLSNTLDLMAATSEVHPLAREFALSLRPTGAFDSPAGRQALAGLVDGSLPDAGPAPALAPDLQAAMEALDASRPDADLVGSLGRVSDGALADALRRAQAYVLALDAATKAVGQVIDQIERQLDRPDVGAALRRDFSAARMAYNAKRYDAEARLNQTIAGFYELQVRKGNLSADRHHRRSEQFFYGMLAAQAGVIISTLAMAARKRNLLWSLAAGAGTVAVSFAVYVYLFV